MSLFKNGNGNILKMDTSALMWITEGVPAEQQEAIKDANRFLSKHPMKI